MAYTQGAYNPYSAETECGTDRSNDQARVEDGSLTAHAPRDQSHRISTRTRDITDIQSLVC